MKKYIISIIVLALLGSFSACNKKESENPAPIDNTPKSYWEKVDGSLKQISVAKDGSIWGVNSNDDVFYRNGSTWGNIPGKFQSVSVAADGTVMGIASFNNFYKYNHTLKDWEYSGLGFKQISVAKESSVWGVDPNDDIYYKSGAKWNKIDGKLKWVSVASDGAVWGVNNIDEIFKYNHTTGTWGNPIPGRLKQISVGKEGLVYGVNSEDHVFKLNAMQNGWEEPIPTARLSNISVAADGTVWGVNSANEIFRLVEK